MGKRGQITIFIIIGLILLLSLVLFIYYRNLTIQEPEVVPPQFNPIKEYVSSCIQITGRQAVELLGQQSGYTQLPQQWIVNQDSYLSVDPFGLIKIPYWYYNGESRTPSINSMEQQISVFVEENLDNCLKEFSVFSNTFEIENKRELDVITTIDEEDVRIEANYLLKVKSLSDAETTYLSDFSGILDVKLKKAYELARKIMEKENTEYLLENATMDILSMHPDIPLSGMTFHCGQEVWYLEDIKEELASVMKYQLSRVRIKNTNYIPFDAPEEEYEYFRKFTPEKVFLGQVPQRPAPSDAYDYFHYFWDVGTPETNLRATMQYEPSWDMIVNARPSYGGLLKSDIGKGAKKFLSFMCVNIYHFTYDIEYPVVVIVGDDTAFNNEGFLFRYAFPVLIKKNEGNRVDFGQDVYDVPLEFVDYCGELSGPLYDIRVKGTDEDGYSDMELRDVNISYDCYKYRCSLGKTEPQSGAYKLIKQLPSFCAHGYLLAEKSGYLETRQQVLDDTSIVIDMKKLREFNFSIVMHDYQSAPPAHIDTNAEDLPRDSIALLNLQHHNISELLGYRIYPFDADTTEDLKKIELLEEDADYILDIMLTTEKFGMIGGYRANWTVNVEEMLGKNHITFHVLNYLPVPYRIDDQYKVTVFLDEDQEYKTILKPVFETR